MSASAGHILLLNGTSSAGKSSLAAALQRLLPEPHLCLGADTLGAMLPLAYSNGAHAAEGVSFVPLTAEPPTTAMVVGSYAQTVVAAFHRAVATFVECGQALIVDHLLQEERWLLDCLTAWQRLPVLFVGVRCALEVAEQRERERGDRALGLARWQYDRVHAHGRYDLEVDTGEHRPTVCARIIASYLAEGRPWSAFAQLAQERLR